MPDHEYVKGWMTHQNGGKCCKVCGGSLGEHYKPMLVDGVELVACDPIVGYVACWQDHGNGRHCHMPVGHA